MKYTIEKLKRKYEFFDHKTKKKNSYNGYAFMDADNHVIIIVYTKKRRNDVIKYLLENN